MRLGLQFAVAICLHNVPEGMAVAIPLYAANESSLRILFLVLLNGLAEPLVRLPSLLTTLHETQFF